MIFIYCVLQPDNTVVFREYNTIDWKKNEKKWKKNTSIKILTFSSGGVGNGNTSGVANPTVPFLLHYKLSKFKYYTRSFPVLFVFSYEFKRHSADEFSL